MASSGCTQVKKSPAVAFGVTDAAPQTRKA